MKKRLFILSWLLLLSLGPIAILSKTPFSAVNGNINQLMNLLQRMAGLVAFNAIFVQLVIGVNISKLSKVFGSWIYKFHMFQGIIAYFFVLAHPLLFAFSIFKASGVIDPFYIFTDVCLLCQRPYELYYSIGRISFWLISLAVAAALIRDEIWWKGNWRKFHILNYFIFILIAAHVWLLSVNLMNTFFVYVFWLELTVIAYIVIQKYFLSSVKKHESK